MTYVPSKLAATALSLTLVAGTAFALPPLSRDSFLRFSHADGRVVEAIRLSDADGSDPGRLALIVNGNELRVGTDAELVVPADAVGETVAGRAGKANGTLVVKWQNSQFRAAVTETGRVSSVILADRKDELEVRCVVLSPEGGVFRGALVWRIRKKGVAIDSGSTLFAVAEGKESPLRIKPSKGDPIEALVTLER